MTMQAFTDPDTGFTLDLSGMRLDPAAVADLTEPEPKKELSPLDRAHHQMQRLEAGAIKNPDEDRKVTHFTDRLEYAQNEPYRKVQEFAQSVREGAVSSELQEVEFVVVNGIGGSALGPQLLQFAVNGPYWNELDREARGGWPRIYFVDNTDPAGVADVKAVADLKRTLVVTISKSGATQEARNNRAAFEQAFAAQGLNFARHAVAVTMQRSELAEYGKKHGWLERFPMADSIGGRTSETNIVGHVPAAFVGIDFLRFLAGAQHMDELTRAPTFARNPAYQLAVAWFVAGAGRGDRNMVVVPYADRLALFGKYLQQLVMESLGKKLDLNGNVVHQGLTVYGNKGGTDAHAYIQQLQDGRDDFFLTFIEVLRDREQVELENGLTMGDHLHAFKTGLANALRAKGRRVIDIVIEELDEFGLGLLIALFERAVAVYAELININAFHQPGVTAYKDASGEVNNLHSRLRGWIAARRDQPWRGTAAEAAAEAGAPGQGSDAAGVLAKFAVNGRRFGGAGVTRAFREGEWVFRVE